MSRNTVENIRNVGSILNNANKPLNDRFRALFTLKNLGGHTAIDEISSCFSDSSSLLKHELAYCLGQMQDPYAIGILTKVLEDESQEPMVRHEAGEALGAIGNTESIEILQKYADDPVIEVAETCQLALERINWLNNETEQESLSKNPYASVDPAPPSQTNSVEDLHKVLMNENEPLFQRYRAMFALRNLGGKDAVLALADGLNCSSALFRHEVAYVLGQMQHPASIPQLETCLKNMSENPMVRHECAEALGSIATEDCTKMLSQYLQDKDRVVKESCIVALDISEYANNESFQYADSLSKMQS